MRQDERKILLVEPPFYRLFKETYSLVKYPLSLGYLAGEIRRNTAWSVMAYNADFHSRSERIEVSYLSGVGFDHYLGNLKDSSGDIWKEIRSTIAEYKPAVVGISAKSQNFSSARIVAKLVKELNEQTVVLIGGPHPSMLGADLLNHPEIDICVRGEGERTITELLDAIDGRKSLESIRGIAYRKDGRIVETPPREYIEDLDSLCFPHENAPEVLKDYDQYPVSAFKFVFATRGCPYNCFFCGSRNIWSRKVRFRSPESVVEEIGGLQKRGLKFVQFDDDTFGVNRKYLTDLCNALMLHCPGVRWSCEIHPRLVDEQNLSLMKAAGCCSIKIGIESGNNEILSAIRKNITIEQAFDACKLIKKHGLEVQVFFIVGFPQDTEDTLQDTITAMKKVPADIVIYSIFTPYPGTEAFALCKEKGLIDDDFDVSLYNHQSPANHFCMNIPRERLRVLVSRIERSIDRKNWLRRVRRGFSLATLRRIQELRIGTRLKRRLGSLLGKGVSN